MANMKTPGVYIVEKNAFPSSIVEVATAVPAFIGYTEKAEASGLDLKETPVRISSIGEYHQYFGSGPDPTFSLNDLSAQQGQDEEGPNPAQTSFTFKGQQYQLTRTDAAYLLYLSMVFFFRNGGGPCYVVSVGPYDNTEGAKVQKDPLLDGIKPLVKEQEPTLIVMPDAVRLDEADCREAQKAMLDHCAAMANRFAILDVQGGFQEPNPNFKPMESFRELTASRLDYGAAYYPWLNTGLVSQHDLKFTNLSDTGPLKALVRGELGLLTAGAEEENTEEEEKKEESTEEEEKTEEEASGQGQNTREEEAANGQAVAAPPDRQAALRTAAVATLAEIFPATPVATPAIDPNDAAAVEAAEQAKDAQDQRNHDALNSLSPAGYKTVISHMAKLVNLMPPSGAMAGIYTSIDNSRGVWKAPANVGISSVVSPAVNISHEEQEDLNVDATGGKSINAIRSFVGEGVLVWGARTLAGNSLDWRYIQVRRTMIMLEESIRLASKAYVFEANNANTWITMKGAISNFLTGIWKRGGLAGASPEDAFNVYVGLGETMTPEDILEGILRVTVLVAITRPAEFIEITFQQKMQES